MKLVKYILGVCIGLLFVLTGCDKRAHESEQSLAVALNQQNESYFLLLYCHVEHLQIIIRNVIEDGEAQE